MDTSNPIVKVTKGLSKAAECREDTKLMMQPYANWEEYLTPAPMFTGILAELIFISSKHDFSIRDGGPEGGFKHVKYPDSFRACLMQVCNSWGYAFNEAHKSMNQIRLNTSRVPDCIKTAVKILLQDDVQLVEAILPVQLDSISRISDECLLLVTATRRKFVDVTDLISELLETCSRAKQVDGSELEAVRRKIEESKIRKQAAEEANTRTTEESKLRKQAEKELAEILITLQNCKVKDIDFTTAIRMLSEGLRAMLQVVEQKLLQFFQMVFILVNNLLSKSLEDFTKRSAKASAMKYSQKMFLKDMIYHEAFYASNIASLVNMISGTYTEVSDQYLMDAVSKLSTLISVDVTKPEFQNERSQMAHFCKEAEEGIRNCVRKNKANFEERTKQRLEKIESELKAVLPPEPEEKIAKIREAVQEAYKEDQDEDCYI